MRTLSFSVRHTFLLFVLVTLLSGGFFLQAFQVQIAAALPPANLNGDVNDEVNEDTDVISTFDSPLSLTTAVYRWYVDRDDGNGSVPWMAMNIPMNAGTTQYDASGNDDDAEVQDGDTLFVEYNLTGTGNKFRYDRFDDTVGLPYIIPGTACLEYDMAWKTDERISIDFQFFPAYDPPSPSLGATTVLRDTLMPDQNGYAAHPDQYLAPVAADGISGYYSRQINISVLAGRSINYFMIGAENDAASPNVAFFQNIRITDCSGTDLLTVYDGQDDVTFSNIETSNPGNTFVYRNGPPTLYGDSSCQVGMCYHFPGAPGTIAPVAFDTEVKNTFTIEFWAKPEATRVSSTEQNANFTISGVNGQRYAVFPPQKGAVDAGVGVSVGTNGVSVFEHGNDHLPSLLVYDTPINDWTHVVVTYDLKRPKLYLNGTLVRTGIKSLRNNIYPGRELGGRYNDPTGRGDTYGPYLGYLDEFKLYDHVLTPQQIAQNYNDGLNGDGGPTRILTQEHRVDQVWTLDLFEIEGEEGSGDFVDPENPVSVDTVTIVSGTSETYMTIEDPVGPQTEAVTIDYSCENTEDLARDIIVEFSEDGGNSWSPATLNSASTAGGVSENRILDVPCNSAGSNHDFVWGSDLDGVGAQGAANPNVRVRVTADTSQVGASVLTATTNDFTLQNDSSGTVDASTFLGGDNSDDAVGIGINPDGNPVVIGTTQSEEFPTTVGAFQETDPNVDDDDTTIFITIFNPALQDVLYSTFLGGDGNDAATAGKLDENGNVYIAGSTSSTDFPPPSTVGFDQTGDENDGMLVKLSSSADAVLYFTYFGGSDYDSISDIDVADVNGRVALTGYTYSTDLPTGLSVGFDTTYDGNADGFAALIDTTLALGDDLSFVTYIGGSGDDFGDAVAWDDSGDISYVVGNTNSTDFSGDPSGAFDETFDANGEGYLLQLGSDGTLYYETALGGTGYDYTSDVMIGGPDFDRDIYVCGGTASSDFVTTDGVLGQTLVGDTDVFLYKMKTSFAGVGDLLQGTLVGGASGTVFEHCSDMVLEGNGDVVFSGVAGPNYLTTAQAFDRTYNGAGTEGNYTITKINGDFNRLIYSSYFDGSEEFGVRFGNKIARHPSGDIYMAGSTTSYDFPVFNGFDLVHGDNVAITTDAFVTRFDLPAAPIGDQDFTKVLRHDDPNWETIVGEINDPETSLRTIVAIDTDTDSQDIVNGPTETNLLGFARDYDEAGGVFVAHSDGSSSYARNIFVTRLSNNNEVMWSTQLLTEGGTYTANGFIDMYSDDRGGVFVLLYNGDVFSGNHFNPVLFHLEDDGGISPNYPYDADVMANGSYNLPGLFEYNTGVGRMASVGSQNNRSVAVVTDLGQENDFGGDIHGGNLSYFSEAQGGLAIYSGEQWMTGPITTNVTDEKYEMEIISAGSQFDVLVFWWERRGAMYVLRAQYIDPNDANQEFDYPFGPEGMIIAREPQPSPIQATIAGSHVFVSYGAYVPSLGENRIKTTEFFLDESKAWSCIQRVDGNENFEVLFPYFTSGPHLTWMDQITQGNLNVGTGLYAQIYDAGSGNSRWSYGGELLVSDVELGGNNLAVEMGTPAQTGVGIESGGVQAFYTYRANSLLGGMFGFYDNIQYNGSSFPSGLQGDCDAGFTSDEVLVNTTTDQAQGQVSIDHAEDGSYVVIWSSRNQDGQDQGVFGQRFDNLDLPLGTEFQVNTNFNDDQEANRNSLAVDDDGDFVVTWWDSDALDGNGHGVFLQRYDNEGNPAGAETQVNDFTTGLQTLPSIASEANGDFVVVWQSDEQDGQGYGIYGKRFDAAGNILTPPPAALRGTESGDEFRINTTTASGQENADVAMDDGGNFVVLWRSSHNNRLYFQLYDDTGTPVGGETQVTTNTTGGNHSVSMDADGDFVVVWDEDDGLSEGGTSLIAARLFDELGNAVGSAFQVNQVDDDSQYDPDVAMDESGDFVVTWTSVGQDGDSDGVFYRPFSADGTPVADEAQISQNSFGEQDTTAATMINENYYILAWEDSSDNLDFSDEAVYVRTFRGVASPPEAISDLDGSAGDGEVTLSWTAPSDNGSTITDYIIEYDDGGGFQVFNDGVNVDLEVTVTGLTNGTAYTFRVAAVSDAGQGDYSNTVELTPFASFAYSQFSTYIGGSGDETAAGIGLDTSGNIVLMGVTYSSDFPTENEIQGSLSGAADGFITILSPDGTTALLSTYIGGSEEDRVFAGRVDTAGNIYLAGWTLSDDFFDGPRAPTLSGFDMTMDDEFHDVFVMKFNEDLSEVLYGSFWGGTGSDWMEWKTMRVDNTGIIYLAGTVFENGPLTANAYDSDPVNGEAEKDSFVAKIDSTVSGVPSLLYSTYLGMGGQEYAYGINFDSAGNIYVVGTTNGSDFPILDNALDETLDPVNGDGFMVKFDPTQPVAVDTFVYGTTFGGNNGYDGAYDVLPDASGDIYVCGQFASTNALTTPGAYSESSFGGYDMGFYKISPDADGVNDLLYGTYVGGVGDDSCDEMSFDSNGTIVFVGETSGVFPTPGNSEILDLAGGNDLILGRINPVGNGTDDLVFASYFGGGAEDNPWGTYYDDASDTLYVAGETTSQNFPVSAGVYQSTFGGASDGFGMSMEIPQAVEVSDYPGFSTLLGGSVRPFEDTGERAVGIGLDTSGNIVLIGDTDASDFPVTGGALDTTFNDGKETFISILSPDGTTLLISTYLGGAGSDWANAGRVDTSGNIYLTGFGYDSHILSALPPTIAGYDMTSSSNSIDLYLLKLNEDASEVLYGTYLSGSGTDLNDNGFQLMVDDAGIAYMGGYTDSTDFPVTANAFDATGDATNSDAFVAKIDTTVSGPSSLLYSSYIGGAGWDATYGVNFDVSGNIYVVGDTASDDFPGITSGAFDETIDTAVDGDGFLVKIDPTGTNVTSLAYGTFIGGDTNYDGAAGIAVSATNEVFVCGAASSTDFVTTAGSYSQVNGGLGDAFIYKMSLDGDGSNDLLYGTYISGTGDEWCNEIHLDTNGTMTFSGASDGNFPTTAGAFQSSHVGGYDVIIGRFDPAGNGTDDLVFSSYFGGTQDEYGAGAYYDEANQLYYLSGSTYSNNFPTNVNAYQTDHSDPGFFNAFGMSMEMPNAATIDVELEGGATTVADNEDLNSTVTGLAGDEIGAYQWTVNGNNLMDLNFPANDSLTIADVSGNGSDGTVNGDIIGLYNISGHVGGSFTLDGIDDSISVPTSTVAINNDPYTFEAWIFPNVDADLAIYGYGNYGTTNEANALRLQGGNNIQNYWWGNDLTLPTGDLTGAWHHVAVTFDGTTRAIYIDGVLLGSDTPVGHNVPSNTNFTIGSANGGDFFNGQIDEFRAYSRALSAAQIAQNYTDGNNGVGGPTVIVSQETLENDVWDLYVTPVTDAGGLGVTAHSANTVTVTESVTLSVDLEGGATTLVDDENLDSNVTGLGAGIGAYQWTVDPDGAGVSPVENLMMLNMPFDAGTTQSDASGNSHVATTQNGAVYTVSGQVGGAMSFDGVDDFVVINDQVYLPTQGTVSFWVNRSGVGSGSFPTMTGTIGANRAPTLSVDSAGELYWEFSDLFQQDAGVNIGTGVWHHIVMTYDSSFEVKVYYDGNEVSSGSASNPGDFADEVHIGDYWNGSQLEFFNGLIDEFQIYGRALSPEQITQLYNDGLNGVGGPTIIMSPETVVDEVWDLSVYPVSGAGAVGSASHSANTVTILTSGLTVELEGGATTLIDYGDLDSVVTNMDGDDRGAYRWTIDGNPFMVANIPFDSGSPVTDFSGNGHNGTLVNDVAYTTSGYVGGAMSFDGSDVSKDYVSLGDVDEVDGASEISWAAWINPTEYAPTTNSFSLRSIVSKGEINSSIFNLTTTVFASFFQGNDAGGHNVIFNVETNENFYSLVLDAPTYIPLNTWTHIAATWHSDDFGGDGMVKVYINGALVGQTSPQGGITHPGDTHSLNIGYTDPAQTTDSGFMGLIDEVQVYNRSLDAEQVLQIFTDGINGVGGPTVISGQETEVGEFWDLFVTPINTTAGTIGASVQSNNTVEIVPNNGALVPVRAVPSDGSVRATSVLLSAYYRADSPVAGSTNYRVSSSSASDCLNDINTVASDSANTSGVIEEEQTSVQFDSGFTDGSTYYWCAQNEAGITQSAWTTMGNFDYDITAPDVDYMSYIGGTSADRAEVITVDNGIAYMVGYTESSDFPVTSGVYTSDSPYQDVFVTAFDISQSGNSQLVFSTVIGSSGFVSLTPTEVRVAGGQVYVAGVVQGAGFPTTTGAYDQTFGGGMDGFVFILSSDATSLVYSTLFGGTNDSSEAITGMQVDGGLIYLLGSTTASNLPTTPDAYDSTRGGASDAFMAIIDPQGDGGNDLVYSTYLGGTGSESTAQGIDVYGGNVYVGTGSGSTNFPTTSGAYDESVASGNNYTLSVIDPSISGTGGLIYSTYIGPHFLVNFYVDVDGAGLAHFAGTTSSASFPTTAGAYDTSFNGNQDLVYGVLNPASTGTNDLVYSTYLGGSGGDFLQRFTVENGIAYLVGSTTGGFPLSANAFASVTSASEDGFLVQIDPAGNGSTDVLYSTLIPNGASSAVMDAAVAGDDVYLAVLTQTGELLQQRFPGFKFGDTVYNEGVYGETYVLHMNMSPGANTAPVVGYTADNVIPAAQVTQSANGDGTVTVHFKVRDAQSDLVTLKDFEFSTNSGGAYTPVTLSSPALFGGWPDNAGASYASTPSFNTTYSFSVDTKHADLAALNSISSNTIRFRFKANDGEFDSLVAESEDFTVDNDPPDVDTTVNITTRPTSGDATVTLQGSFTEPNPAQNLFQVAKNGGNYGNFVIGQSNTATPAAQPTTLSTWDTSILDTVGNLGSHQALYVSTSDVNTLYIAWYDNFLQRLFIDKSTDAGANFSASVDMDAGNTEVGSSVDLTGFGSNLLFATYYDSQAGDLKFTTSSDGGAIWTRSIIDSSGDVGRDTSILASSATDIYVSYYDVTNGNLKFAKSTDAGDNWTISTLDSSGDVGRYTSIDVKGGKVFISYYDVTNSALKVIVSGDNGDNFDSPVAVDSTGIVGEYSSLSAVNATTVYVSYYDRTNGDLKIASSTDSGATFPSQLAIDQSGDVGLHTAVKTLSTGEIFVSYYDKTQTQQKFAQSSNGGTSFSISTTFPTDFFGIHNDLYPVSPSVIYVTSRNDFGNNVLFQKSTDGGATFGDIVFRASNSIGAVGPSVVAADENTIVVSYYDYNLGDLKFAKSTDGGDNFSISTIESTGNVGGFSTIKAFDLDTYGVCYRDQGNDRLRFARTDDGGASWDTYLVDDVGTNVGRQCDMTFVDNDTVYIVANEGGTGTVFYKSIDGGVNWPTNVLVDAVGGAGGYTGIGFTDGGDTIFLSYRPGKFAKSTDGGLNWSVQTLDSASVQQTLLRNFGDTIYVALYMSDKRLKMAKSVDAGDNWTLSTVENSPITHTNLRDGFSAFDTDNLYLTVGDVENNELLLYQSSDAGATWTHSVVVENNASILTNVFARDSSHVYVVHQIYENSVLGLARGVNQVFDGDDVVSKALITHIDDFGNEVLNENLSLASNLATVMPLVPEAPTGTSLSTTSHTIVIVPNELELGDVQYSIRFVSTNGTEYVQSDGTLDTTPFFQTFSAWGGVAGIDVTGLEEGIEYTVDVNARNPNGDNVESAYGADYVFEGAVVPDAITDLVAVSGNAQVTLTWTAPADNGSPITDYIVEYGETSGFPGNAQVFSDGVSATTGAVVTGLVNGTDYSFRVAAVNAVGTGPYSNVDTATPSAAVPSAVTDLDATAGNTQVTLTWTAPANNGSAITDYIVEYGETSGFPGNAQVFSDGVSATTGAIVTGLVNGTDYSFRVAAVNAIGTGPYSNIDTATPTAAVPSAITNLVAIPGNGQATLTWTAPANNGSAITDYIVEFGPTTGFPGNAQVFSDGVSATTGAIVTGLVNGVDYSFRVAAVNAIGTGPYSNVATATPATQPPGNTADTDITVDVTDFLSFAIANTATGDEPAGDQPFGAGAQTTSLTPTSATNAYAISGNFGSPVFTQLEVNTNSQDGYSVFAYAVNGDGRTTAFLRNGGSPGNADDQIPDTLQTIRGSQAANVALNTASDTGLALRLTDANTDPLIHEADEDTQWGADDGAGALWAALPLGNGAAQVIYDTIEFNGSPTVAFINWFVGVAQQRTGSYAGQVIFSATVN